MEVVMAVGGMAVEGSVAATAAEAMGAGVMAVVTEEAAKAVVRAAAQWPHQHNSALHAAHKLVRIDRFCGCCPSPQYAD